MKRLFVLMLLGLVAGATAMRAENSPSPFRIAIIGLVHDHAQGFIAEVLSRKDVELVGIAEANPELVARYASRFDLPAKLFHPTLEQMLDATGATAVAVCSSTFDHAHIVEVCAARGVHVMVEKPLAVNLAHARAIVAAANRGGIHVVVNYETTWYPSTQEALRLIRDENAIGDLRRIIVNDGHSGPREIGASAEFLAWLTDPVLNGGGAFMDFGCYGADLITMLMRGQRPTSVTAVAQTTKPALYPHVDDEATIVLGYPHAQGIIQASWNWPFGRKDMEIYGTTGFILAPDAHRLRVRTREGAARDTAVPPLEEPRRNPISYFAAIVRGEIEPEGLSSLDTNLVVTEILDAARESIRTGRRIDLEASGGGGTPPL